MSSVRTLSPDYSFSHSASLYCYIFTLSCLYLKTRLAIMCPCHAIYAALVPSHHSPMSRCVWWENDKPIHLTSCSYEQSTDILYNSEDSETHVMCFRCLYFPRFLTISPGPLFPVWTLEQWHHWLISAFSSQNCPHVFVPFLEDEVTVRALDTLWCWLDTESSSWTRGIDIFGDTSYLHFYLLIRFPPCTFVPTSLPHSDSSLEPVIRIGSVLPAFLHSLY